MPIPGYSIDQTGEKNTITFSEPMPEVITTYLMVNCGFEGMPRCTEGVAIVLKQLIDTGNLWQDAEGNWQTKIVL